MDIRLRPELEALIKQDVERGPYRSVDEFVEHAVSLLHEQENWLAEHGSEIRAKIEKGYASAQRGDSLDSDQVRSTLEERKRAWLAHNRRASAVTGSHAKRFTPSSPSGAASQPMAWKQPIARFGTARRRRRLSDELRCDSAPGISGGRCACGPAGRALCLRRSGDNCR